MKAVKSETEAWNIVQDAGHLDHNGWSISVHEPLTCACGQLLAGTLLAFEGACGDGCTGCAECEPINVALRSDGPTREETLQWRQASAQILSSLQGYEDAHPAGVPCFKALLDAAEAEYARIYGATAS